MSTRRHASRVVGAALISWTVVFLYSLAVYIFFNDHFGRISPGRQIAIYGELPFRDYLDPGYVLTEFASAAVQRLFGDNLLGEMLLTSSFVAGGAVAILLLVRRATGSMTVGVAAMLAAVLAFRRPYDYDKFLFYPLGLLACWRYVDTRRSRDLVLAAVVAVVAGMFRYDNGVFVGASALVAVAGAHAVEPRLLLRRLGLLAGAIALLVAPYALFLQMNGGLTKAADQMLTYARREGARTKIGQLPPVLSEVRLTPLPPPPPDRVQIRWAPEADNTRAALESRYTLHDGVQQGEPAERIWRYEIDDASRENLHALVNDPAVADTAMVNRSNLTLTERESWMRRLRRKIPFIGTTALSWSLDGAAAAVYYFVIAISLGAVVLAWLRPAADSYGDRARVFSAAAMTLLAAALVMRDPVIARIGGVIGPPVVLAAWLWHRASRLRVTRVLAAAIVLWSLSVATEWDWSIDRVKRRLESIDAVMAGAVATPPITDVFPAVAGIVDYVRRCTTPADRVFAGWFVPELYYFSQRAFAGGTVATFGDHWSEPENQRRIVEKIKTESVPVALLARDARREFRQSYPLIDDYFLAHYDDAGAVTFGPGDTYYTVLTRRGRVPTGQDPVFAIPCFARPDAR